MNFWNDAFDADEPDDDSFPWKETGPIAIPRFGLIGPTITSILPDPEFLAGGTGDGYALFWADPGLGLKVELLSESGEHGDELRAYVDSTHPAGSGVTATVVLRGNLPGPPVRCSVKLDTPTASGSSGDASFGSLARIQEQLGDSMTMEAILVVPPGR